MLIALYSYGQRAGKNTASLYIAEWCIDHKVPFIETSFAAKGEDAGGTGTRPQRR